MWVTILPFILVANVTINNDSNPVSRMYFTEYEHTYEVVLDMSLTNVTKESDNYCRVAVGNLKCRAKQHDILTCYFKKGMRIINTAERCTHEDRFYPEYEIFGNDDPFEVRFTKDGIEDLIVSRKITKSKLDKLKAVLRQLNIGLNIRYRYIDIKSTEKKQHDCEYEDEYNEFNTVKNGNLTEGESFQLAFTSSRNASHHWTVETGLRLRKVKLTSKCPPTFIFENQISRNYNDSEVSVKTIASVKDIKISKNEFMSSTISDVVMYTPTSRIMRLKQKLSVELKRIDLANFPIREINNPAWASMTAFSGLKKIPKKKFFVTQQ